MSDAFSHKHGARLPSRTMNLTGNGLTNLDTIDPGSMSFIYRAKAANTRTVLPAVIADSATMKIRVDLDAASVGTIGTFQWHIEATIGGKVICWPEKGFYTYSVTETIEVV